MPPAERLLSALDALREAVRHGDFPALTALAERVSAELAALERAPPDGATLRRIGSRASETAAILQAAARGLAAARQRLAEVERLRHGPVTYGGDGKPRVLGGPAASLRRV